MLSGAMSPTHWLLVIVVLVVLFGAKKLPEAARGLGRSARILKAEVNGLHEDESPRNGTPATGNAPTPAPTPATAPAATPATPAVEAGVADRPAADAGPLRDTRPTEARPGSD